MVETRTLAGREIYPIGFGAMNVSHCYQPRLPDEEGGRVLQAALDLGYTHFDTAAIYGHGHNEALIGKYLSHRRDEIVLTSKCGIVKDPDTGKRGINNRTDLIRRSIDETLSLLKTDHLDMFYLHRWDKITPIEDVVGEMGRLVEVGKVRTLGLSEVSADTLRKAHATHQISAVQSEYSLWTRNPEIAVLEACRELGATFVAFSPVARQFLTGTLTAVDGFCTDDIRNTMPRFEPEIYSENLKLLTEYRAIASEVGCTEAQLALAWLLTRGNHVVPIPGTQSIPHLEENFHSARIELSPAVTARLDSLINEKTVKGGRYNPTIQKQIDTEEFV